MLFWQLKCAVALAVKCLIDKGDWQLQWQKRHEKRIYEMSKKVADSLGIVHLGFGRKEKGMCASQALAQNIVTAEKEYGSIGKKKCNAAYKWW